MVGRLKQAGWIAVLCCWAIGFVFVVWSASPHSEHHNRDQPAKSKNQNSDARHSREDQVLDRWSLSDKIAVIASVVAFLQFFALMATVYVMRRTGQRQLRAYIVAGATDVDMRGPENEVSVSLEIVIKNTGQTPAHELSVVSRTRLLEHPIKMPFDFTLQTGGDPSRDVLGAGQQTESRSLAEHPLNGDEMMRAGDPEGGFRVYTWGTVTYRDVFGHKHYTNFCSSLIFENGEAIAHASEHHNDAS